MVRHLNLSIELLHIFCSSLQLCSGGSCGSGSRAGCQLILERHFHPRLWLHVELSLGKVLNPKFLLMAPLDV